MTLKLLKFWINRVEECSLKHGDVWYLAEKGDDIVAFTENCLSSHPTHRILYNTRDKIFPSWYKFTTAEEYQSQLEGSKRRSELTQIRGGNTDIEF